MRRAHILAPNRRTQSVYDAVFFDTETTERKLSPTQTAHYLKFGFAAGARRLKDKKWSAPQWVRFTTPEYFWDWLESRLHGKCKLYCFAHNLSFDLPVLKAFSHLPKRGWKMKNSVMGCPPTMFRFTRGDQTIVFIDTLNYWRSSLAEVGKSIGLDKLAMPKKSASNEEWDRYGKRDVEILLRALMEWFEFIEANDLGEFAITIAGQAFNAFRHRFMHHRLFIDDDSQALDVARAAYVGGRTECFFLGQASGQFFQLDINSMYPAVMQSTPVPTSILKYSVRLSVDELAREIKTNCVCADVTLSTEAPAFPVIRDNRLVFPVGRFRASLSTPELAYALRHARIEHIHRAAIYRRGIVFKSYVEWFYARRLQFASEGRHIWAGLSKLFLNSLYGKMGQRGQHSRVIGDSDPDDISTWQEYDAVEHRTYTYRKYAGVIEECWAEGESRNSFPAIAAHITAAARVRLFELMQVAGRENIFYADTDSLVVNAVGFELLRPYLSPDKLGMLKLEHTYKNISIKGLKDYNFDERQRVKGVRRGATWINQNTVEQEQFSSLKSLLRGGDMQAPIVSKVTKHLERIYTKGEIAHDGRVLPFRLVE